MISQFLIAVTVGLFVLWIVGLASGWGAGVWVLFIVGCALFVAWVATTTTLRGPRRAART